MTPPFSTAALPFVMPAADVFFSSPKKVYAHYFRSFPLSIDNGIPASDYYNTQFLSVGGENGKHAAYGGYLRQRPLAKTPQSSSTWKQMNMQIEVAMAISRGITGFCFDVLSLTDGLIQLMLSAASLVDPRFKIIPMLDMGSLGTGLTTAQALSYLESIVTAPAIQRLPDGRIVLAAYNAPVESVGWWTALLEMLNAAGINVAFLPIFLGEGGDGGALSQIAWGVGGWGTATPGPALAMNSALAHSVGLKSMFPVIPQEFRPKDQKFWEASNSLAFRNSWIAAIGNGADFVQCVTWNDFSESSQVCPYTDATLDGALGTAFYDLTAYYATWFVTGQAPVITQDVLYWFHRRETAFALHPQQPDGFTPVLAGGGPEEDFIELVAFLTDPGTIQISIGGVTHSVAAPKMPSLLLGDAFTSIRVPLVPGVPTFTLRRNGSNVFSAAGPVTIYGAQGQPSGVLDLTYWGGSVTKAGLTRYALS